MDLKNQEEILKEKIINMIACIQFDMEQDDCLFKKSITSSKPDESINPKKNKIMKNTTFKDVFIINKFTAKKFADNDFIIISGDIKKNLTFTTKKEDEEKLIRSLINESNNNCYTNNFISNYDTTKTINNIQNKKKKYNRSVSIRKSILISNLIYGKKKYKQEKFREFKRRKLIFDSHEDDESDEEQEVTGIVLDPELNVVLYFDILICVGTLYSVIISSIKLASIFCLCEKENKVYFSFEIFTDILFIFDLLISFIRGYYTKQDKVIKDISKIIKNYIFGWFLFDLLSALPFFTYNYYKCKYNNDILNTCFTYYSDSFDSFFNLLIILKHLKLLKIMQRNNNQFITRLKEKMSENIKLENISDLSFQIFKYIMCLHILACFYIFIGRHNSPSWITANNFQSHPFNSLYITSVYYILTSMTTVGYGDISPKSSLEIFIQVLLLGAGIIIYSWLVSSIGNDINKESYASINFANESKILEEIRITHPNLSYKVYKEIQKYIEFRNFRPKKNDKTILINDLPYTVKNELIISMYNKYINNLGFFKGISNSNFILKVVMNFGEVVALKNEILLKEDGIIEEMYFVKEGRLGLEISINENAKLESIEKYLCNDFLSFTENEIKNTNAEINSPKLSKPSYIKSPFREYSKRYTMSPKKKKKNKSRK